MLRITLAALAALIVCAGTAEAAPSGYCPDLSCFWSSPEVRVRAKSHRVALHRKAARRAIAAPGSRRAARPMGHRVEARFVAHPRGCPTVRFCGCGVSLHVFGKAVRRGGLAVASAWFRFPPAAAGPGMVAVRAGHVFAIIRMIEPGLALAYDPNSGGHRTRVHARALAGYSVRNPHASRHAALR